MLPCVNCGHAALHNRNLDYFERPMIQLVCSVFCCTCPTYQPDNSARARAHQALDAYIDDSFNNDKMQDALDAIASAINEATAPPADDAGREG